MTDPDLEIRAEVDHSDPKMGGRGGGGLGPSLKKILPQFGQKVRGGGSDPRVPPLYLPLKKVDGCWKACIVCDRMRKESNMNSHFLNHMS